MIIKTLRVLLEKSVLTSLIIRMANSPIVILVGILFLPKSQLNQNKAGLFVLGWFKELVYGLVGFPGRPSGCLAGQPDLTESS